MIYNILLVLALFFTLALYYSYTQDKAKKLIPQKVFFYSLGVGYLTKILSLIFGVSYGDGITTYIFITILFLGLIYTIPEKIIGGGDLKLYLSFYVLFPNFHILLFIIILSNILGAIDLLINRKKNILFAEHILISYCIFFVITLYQDNIFFLF